MRKILLAIFLFLNFIYLSATHNRAGEITYVQLSALTYEITITTFTYTLSYADREELDVDWGDNSISTAKRISKVTLPNYYRRNIYKITHTFPGPGIYKIVVQDPNRNYGVKNIPNSVNVVFSIATTLIVNPSMGFNSTPVLLNPPYDKAALGYVFIHNPAAYDPDGDSLSYKLTVCTRENGKPIEGYKLPPATNFIKVDSITGDLIWNTPADTGKYNVAMEIQEWRNGKKIGVVVRDMQIEVFITSNKPPINGPLKNLCVEVGDTVDFIVRATDPNNDWITLRATSGVFAISSCRATFTGIDSVRGSSTSRFRWIPCHSAVRGQPYNIIFKADDDNPELKLSDIDNMNIKVLGPSPDLISAGAVGKFMNLRWSNYNTSEISGFSIYRKEEHTVYIPDSCTSGLPSSSGFTKVGFAAGSNAISFTDTDNGNGLELGTEYIYRICAVYANGTESKVSNEITSTLVSGNPIIRNVSVINTDQVNGSIFISWERPADTLMPPFVYNIYRADGLAGTNYTLVTKIVTNDRNDTVFTNSPLNTLDRGYIYNISLRSNGVLVGDSSYASSVFITLSPGDGKTRFSVGRNVPWINSGYDIFRYNELTLSYDSVGTSDRISFIDDGLENGRQYCYYIRTRGGYLDQDLPQNLINLSQRACSTPVDNEPPCVPDLEVTSDCEEMKNILTWSFPQPTCINDVAGYTIHYRPYFDEVLDTLLTINDRNVFTYEHDTLSLIAGCYAISAFDSLGNVSDLSVIVCIDDCKFYEIPNVFTPNNDGFNDRLIAKTSGLIETVDFKLFNRSGLMIFSTDNPRIEWDGTYKGRVVSPGIYFYQCDYFERRMNDLEQFHLSGFVHVITVEGVKIKETETK